MKMLAQSYRAGMVPAYRHFKSDDPDANARLWLELNGELAAFDGALQVMLQRPSLS